MSAPTGREYETIRIERLGDRVVHLQLDRRGELNAITETLLSELGDGVEAVASDDETQVLVVSGAGTRAFSVGAAVRDEFTQLDGEAATELSRRGQRAFGTLQQFPGPVIASVDGYCLGGGMELAACADLRIASPDATFGQPELDLGVLPGWGGTRRLTRIVGAGRAKEIVLTAAEYDAETMADYGFLNQVTEEPFEAASDLAVSLATHDQAAQRCAKRAIDYGGGDSEPGLRFESLAFGRTVDQLDE